MIACLKKMEITGSLKFVAVMAYCAMVIIGCLIIVFTDHSTPQYQFHQRTNCSLERTYAAIRQLKAGAIVFPNFSAPYNLQNSERSDYSQLAETLPLFKKYYFEGKRNGFFIEAGALDGETYSNTLALEKDFHWTGLLVEPSSDAFADLRRKNRKAFILNGCISDVCGIEERTISGWLIKEGNSECDFANEKPQSGVANTSKIQCYSFEDIIAALDIRHVDWMFLDMEGYEPQALRSFPWETVTVDLVQLETGTPEPKKLSKIRFFVSFLEERGFEEQNSLGIDVLFRRKASNLKSFTDGKRYGDLIRR